MKTTEQLEQEATNCNTIDALRAWDDKACNVIDAQFMGLPRTRTNARRKDALLGVLNKISTHRYDALAFT